MKLLKILPLIILMLFLSPAKSFADMPEISAGETYFDVLKGYYVLKEDVKVVINNHGHHAVITANEAKVNVLTQKCWAEGKVHLSHDKETFSCDKAYLQWKTRTAEVIGNVEFNSKKVLTVSSDSAVFNWKTKIVDFYGNVKIKTGKNLQIEDGLKVNKKKTYSHIQYNVVENKMLVLEENSDTEVVDIPDPDNDKNTDTGEDNDTDSEDNEENNTDSENDNDGNDKAADSEENNEE